MPASSPSPTLGQLYRLDKQLGNDRSRSLEQLRERDHAIGQDCPGNDDAAALLHWLDRVDSGSASESEASWLNETHAALIMRLIALVAGLLAMAGCLLASDRGLVNVFLLLALFVLVPLVMSSFAAWALWRSVRGSPPPALSINPARFVSRYALPDRRFLKEGSSVMRLLLLKYGQELGACFAVGSLVAFMALLAFNDFSFVWGSTFGFSDELVSGVTAIIAAPWSTLGPAALVSPEVITETRYHAAQLDLGAMSADSRRAWWPFLFMSLLLYSLLPRVLLWWLTRRAYQRELTRSFLAAAGAGSVLARMRAPVVTTQAPDTEHEDAQSRPLVLGEGAVLLEWAGALGRSGLDYQAEHHLQAGLGSPSDELDSIEAINRLQPSRLLVAVKAWEPPMADLADVLVEIDGVSRCSLQLVSLPGRELGESSLRDWQAFAAQLPFDSSEAVPAGRADG